MKGDRTIRTVSVSAKVSAEFLQTDAERSDVIQKLAGQAKAELTADGFTPYDDVTVTMVDDSEINFDLYKYSVEMRGYKDE